MEGGRNPSPCSTCISETLSKKDELFHVYWHHCLHLPCCDSTQRSHRFSWTTSALIYTYLPYTAYCIHTYIQYQNLSSRNLTPFNSQPQPILLKTRSEALRLVLACCVIPTTRFTPQERTLLGSPGEYSSTSPAKAPSRVAVCDILVPLFFLSTQKRENDLRMLSEPADPKEQLTKATSCICVPTHM